MYELIICDQFSSAHFLRGYAGACENLHGHTWRVEVTIESNELNAIGLVVDFKDLKKCLALIMQRWDHVCLNELPEFQEVNPSTENLARILYQQFKTANPQLKIVRTRVWESANASVKYSE